MPKLIYNSNISNNCEVGILINPLFRDTLYFVTRKPPRQVKIKWSSYLYKRADEMAADALNDIDTKRNYKKIRIEIEYIYNEKPVQINDFKQKFRM